MKSRLTLLIPEHWPQTPECEWQLSDRDGRPAQCGRSAPRHWPRADEHVAILDGAQTSLLTITVPPSRRKDRPALIAYALEARLAREVDQEHVTIVADTAASAGANPDARQLAVLVAGTARLRQVCAQFDALQRPLHRAVSIFECLAASPECWQAASGDGRSAALRTGTGSAIAFDLPQQDGDDSADQAGEEDGDERVAAIATILDLALRDAGSPPQRIELAFTPALPAPCCDALAQRTGIALHPLGFDAIWARSAQAHTLLHGGFAPKVGVGASLWTTLRWPALAAGAALVLAGIAIAAGVLADRGEADRLAQRQDRVFADAMPGTPAVAPALQLQRALRDARHAQGELAENDMLSMLGAVVAVTGSVPEAFTYREQRLIADLPAAPASTAAFARHGLAVEADGKRLSLSLAP